MRLFRFVRRLLFRLAVVVVILTAAPVVAFASPFDTGINNVATLFTGTIAKAASLIAIVLGGIAFATGEQGAGRKVAGIVFGVGMAIMAVQVLSWITS